MIEWMIGVDHQERDQIQFQSKKELLEMTSQLVPQFFRASQGASLVSGRKEVIKVSIVAIPMLYYGINVGQHNIFIDLFPIFAHTSG